MRKILFLGFVTGVLLASCSSLGNSLVGINNSAKLKNNIDKVIYCNPVILPEIDEIKTPTYQAFFGAVSDELLKTGNTRLVRVASPINYDEVNSQELAELCLNNGAQAAIVPKIKYFKVGFGNYVFSNQVVVSLKLYDHEGNFIMETSYDTYKGNARLVGKAENSIKIGTVGAIKKMTKELRKRNMVSS